MVQVELLDFDGYGPFTRMIRLSASFPMMPHTAPKALLEFWGPNLANRPHAVLRIKPCNPTKIAYPLCFLHDLDACHHLSSITWSPSPRSSACLGKSLSWLGQHRLRHLLVYTCLSTLASVIHPRSTPAPWSKPPRPSFTDPDLSAWTRLTFTIAIDRLNAQHLHTSQERHVAHTTYTHAIVSLKH